MSRVLNKHIANTVNFMSRQAHDSTVALPSQTNPAFSLPSTAQYSLDPLGNDPWASDIALRPTQQQQQTQIPFTTNRDLKCGRTLVSYRHGKPPPPTWGCDINWVRGCRVERPPGRWIIHHGNHGPRSSSEVGLPGTRCSTETLVAELSFWRHDTSTPPHDVCVKLYKALPLGTVGRSLADQFSEEQICSSQGSICQLEQHAIIFDRIWRRSLKCREKWPLYHDTEPGGIPRATLVL